ncbi:hypothetical protein [Lysobacter gummosus]|uniref:hypothetical protein n=1 Tax=Lysobacter gummosus TaxID=262324 RepID=UPI0036393675
MFDKSVGAEAPPTRKQARPIGQARRSSNPPTRKRARPISRRRRAALAANRR